MNKYLFTYTLYNVMGLYGYGDSTVTVKGRGQLKEVDLERIRAEISKNNGDKTVVFHTIFKLGD